MIIRDMCNEEHIWNQYHVKPDSCDVMYIVYALLNTITKSQQIFLCRQKRCEYAAWYTVLRNINKLFVLATGSETYFLMNITSLLLYHSFI